MKLVLGLGNPGARYDDTRHNVGWWMMDRLAYDMEFGAFERKGPVLVSEGNVGDEVVRLAKPTTYMNRSGSAVGYLVEGEELSVQDDLLVVVDDATLEAGRVRLRPSGSAGGHNGLKSIEAVLGHREYPRLRIGVGIPPQGGDLTDWVLSPMPEEDEDAVLEVISTGAEIVRVWIEEGIEAARSRFNR